jgi:tetrapyrrole methylase family protein/MazG family protein
MEEFEALLKTTDYLLGPQGCPWDRTQTMHSIRACIIEEACELVDAIDLENNDHIREELGDLLFVALFLCRLAEKEKRSTLSAVLKELNEKLIRRHPHVFEGIPLKNGEQPLDRWNAIKNKEKGKEHRKSALDSIPKGLPALARAHKFFEKANQTSFKPTMAPPPIAFQNEEELGELLCEIAEQARSQGLEAEHALRKKLSALEQDFRQHEAASTSI